MAVIDVPTPEPATPPKPLETFGASTRRRPLVRWGKVLVSAMVAVAVLAVGGGVLRMQLAREPVVPVIHHALVFTPEQTLRYGVNGSMDFSMESRSADLLESVTGTAEATLAMRVGSVDRKGVATLHVDISKAKASVDGERLPAPRGPMTVKVTPGGRVLPQPGGARSDLFFSAVAFGNFDLFSPHLPGKEVPKGQRWSRNHKTSLPGMKRTLTVWTKSRFLRYQRVQGVRAAVVRTTVTIPFSASGRLSRVSTLFGGPGEGVHGVDPKVTFSGRLRGKVTGWFDLETGTMLKSFGTSVVRGRFGVRGGAGSLPGDLSFEANIRVGSVKLS